MKIAILDFGTNTFNLLIADTSNSAEIKYLHSSKQAVKLGEGGIGKGMLTSGAVDRAMAAIDNHYKVIKEYGVDKVYAYATSAIREAKNSRDLLQKIKEKYDLYVNIIPGDREAELIYKGVRQTFDIGENKVLILDIGGGSNEFIICDKTKIYWKESFKLGMARMLDQFKPEDPISKETCLQITRFFRHELTSLFDAVEKYQPEILVGASGSFETFYALLKQIIPAKYSDEERVNKEIYGEDFRGLHEILLKSTTDQRKQMKGMEPVRVEMIVLASIFVDFILRELNINRMMFSEYALKEGIVAELLNF